MKVLVKPEFNDCVRYQELEVLLENFKVPIHVDPDDQVIENSEESQEKGVIFIEDSKACSFPFDKTQVEVVNEKVSKESGDSSATEKAVPAYESQGSANDYRSTATVVNNQIEPRIQYDKVRESQQKK